MSRDLLEAQRDVEPTLTPTADPDESTATSRGPSERAGAHRQDRSVSRGAELDVPRRRERDRYIDSLRTLALLRVIVYHLFGWIWLPFSFPSMGVMFALAGSLMAASLDRETGNYGLVLRKRMKRLLPPLWTMGAVLVPAMLFFGWTHSEDAGSAFEWQTMLRWLVPVATPPSSERGNDWVLPLWYISTYFWLVILSPAMLWLFRRWPLQTMVVPAVVTLLMANGLLWFPGAAGDVVLNVGTYAGCWMLGFAHHDGRLRALPLWRAIIAGTAAVVAGLIWVFLYPDNEGGANVTDVPVATMLYSLGVVVILLRAYLDFSWMKRLKLLDGFVAAVNRRAMTIYLYGNISIAIALWATYRWSVTQPIVEAGGVWGGVVQFVGTLVVVGLFVLAVGWVEDVAARRRPRLLP